MLPYQAYTVMGSGSQIHVRYHRSIDAPRLMLLHGGGAHGGWWDAVAPLLADDYELIVPDLAGCGFSQHRSDYAPELWAEDLVAVLDAFDIPSVDIVAHSMGSFVSIVFSALHPERVGRLVMIDAPFRGPSELSSIPRGRPRLTPPTHPTLKSALEKFRFRPDGLTSADPTLVRSIALQSLKRVPEGWAWRFDPQSSQRFTDEILSMHLKSMVCPVGYIFGSESKVGGEAAIDVIEQIRGVRPPSRRVDGAYHHVPLDQPDACAAAIEDLLAELRCPPIR